LLDWPEEMRDLFLEDARRHLHGAADRLSAISAEPGVARALRRHAHSLKGLGAAVEVASIRDVARALESLAAAAEGRSHVLEPHRALIAEALEHLEQVVEAVAAGDDAVKRDTASLVGRIEDAREGCG